MEDLDISLIKKFEDKTTLGYQYWNGLRKPCNGGLFVSEDKGLYEYVVYSWDSYKEDSYFRKIKDLSNREFLKVLLFIKFKIGKKEFKSEQGTDRGATVVVNYKTINRKISYCREFEKTVYKFLDSLKK